MVLKGAFIFLIKICSYSTYTVLRIIGCMYMCVCLLVEVSITQIDLVLSVVFPYENCRFASIAMPIDTLL